MDAQEYVNGAKPNRLITLQLYEGEDPVDPVKALVLDSESGIAIAIEDCGDPIETGIARGAIIQYSRHPEASTPSSGPRVIGRPAYFRPVSYIRPQDGTMRLLS